MGLLSVLGKNWVPIHRLAVEDLHPSICALERWGPRLRRPGPREARTGREAHEERPHDPHPCVDANTSHSQARPFGHVVAHAQSRNALTKAG